MVEEFFSILLSVEWIDPEDKRESRLCHFTPKGGAGIALVSLRIGPFVHMRKRMGAILANRRRGESLAIRD